MHDTTVDQQPVDLLQPIEPVTEQLPQTSVPKRRPLRPVGPPWTRHRAGEPGKVPVQFFLPYLLPDAPRNRLVEFLGGAR